MHASAPHPVLRHAALLGGIITVLEAGSGCPTTSTEPTEDGATTSVSSSAGSSSSSSSGAGSTSTAATGTSSSGAGSSSGAASTSSSSGTGLAAPAVQTVTRYFPDNAPWYQDVTNAPVAADSADITSWMVGHSPPHGWGTEDMRVDFSIVAVEVPAGTTKRTHESVEGYFYTPDCDTAAIPVTPYGAVEETYGTPTELSSPFSGYNCGGFDDGADCHMLFVARSENRLYEVYHATIDDTDTFRTGCLAIWDTQTVSADGRGQQCTSADAAGFPIAPLLFTPEEIAAGEINHALRFILPNDMIRQRRYVAPATHGTNTTGPTTSGPYGFHMRLRADYPVENLDPAAQVVARALQRYGMYLADGGRITLTAQSDVLSTVKWADVGFDPFSLAALSATDFEVIDHGPTTDVTYDCQRTPITQ
ncbi:MAG: hypothetical protein AB2A00_27090 [Myxococcota bacterium]